MDHEGRITKLRQKVDALEIDALLVTDLTNVRYLTGFSGSNGQVLVTESEAYFFSDGRYAARAADLVQGAEIDIYGARLVDVLNPRLNSGGIKRLGIEAETMTLADRDDLDKRVDDVELIPMKNLVEALRRVKDADEVAHLRQAVEIGDAAFSWLLTKLAPGQSERDVALELEIWIRQHGADEISFDPIVGSGELSAHIHHTPSHRQFEKGDLVLLDFGSRKDGYCSDLTRTVVLGPASDRQRELYDLVLEAQVAGIAALEAGADGVSVDAAARKVIEDAGHGDDFGHGLGHGVGLDIHESPRLHRISEDTLLEGDVVTVEPGVYLPGWGGVRIEDCVLVTEDGCEVLGSAPKDALIEL
ncbi:MAG: M24 family metallopeptidase [Actinomycetota bacterium]